MRTRCLRFFTTGVAAAILFIAGAGSAMAQSSSTKTTIHEPLNFVGLTCDTFEPITFTGSQKTVYEVKDAHDGTPRKLHMTVSWDDVTGTTLSGRVYKGTSTYKETYDLDGLPSYHKISINQRFKSKTKGAADSIYTLKFKVRVDETGTVTQQKESEKVECK